MRDGDKAFAGAIPALYDRLFVPLIFQPYAEDIAPRVAAGGPSSVLEIAAGTGVVTRALAPLLGETCRYVVTDLNEPMLNHARTRQPEDPRIIWRTADALALPFEDASFDVVVCQFGTMFFPDRVAGYREALRVTRPGGRFIFSTWGEVGRNDFAACLSEAVAKFFPDNPPDFIARIPHGYFDPARIRSDLEAAGYKSITIDPVTTSGTAERPEDVATAFCQGTPMRNEFEARGASLAAITEHVARAMERRFGPGPVSGDAFALVVTAAA